MDTKQTKPMEEMEPLYLNSRASIAERVEDLISRMTRAEKVAQVASVSLRDSVAEEEGVAGIAKAVRELIGNGVGQIENTFDPRGSRASVEELNSLQSILREKTRLGIPALVGSECAHGLAARNSTVLPVPLAMACSWNPSLIEKAFSMVGHEARLRGSHEAHSPVLDVGRDPRWGRIEETFGEDTYLVTQMGTAAVAGLQGGRSGNPGRHHVIASPKHFAGYGQVSGGRNFAATSVDRRTLLDEILPPFESAVKEAGAQGMMASHCDVDGVPAHGNRQLLTELLRDQWGFEGFVVSDYNDVPRLAFFQHVVETVEEAGALALEAGLDVDLPVGEAYGQLEPVIEKRPELELFLDASVRRVLRLKFMLGLFEEPFVDPDKAEQTVGCAEHVSLAGQVANESIVLLKNENSLLPLDLQRLRSIAVIGPNAASREVGNYTAGNDQTVSILEGIKEAAGSRTDVYHAVGCGIAQVGWDGKASTLSDCSPEEERSGIEDAVETARRADAAVVCVGGNTQTSREAFFVDGIKGDRATLTLLGNQKELVLRILETGTPTVVVLMGGRPVSSREMDRRAPAILNTFYLGQCNGRAVADVLFGIVNPSGKLPVTIPRSVGQLPVYYSQKAISHYKDYLDEAAGPLYPFGHGLSYTVFEYSELEMAETVCRIAGPVSFRLKVRNKGNCSGAEVVQVYFRDRVASIIRPAKLLVRFHKVYLEPGEEQELNFTLDPPKDLAFTGSDMKKVVEPGEFELMVGSSSRDIRLRSAFTLAR